MNGARRAAMFVLAIFFILAGANHFAHPGVYERIVPAWLPARRLLVAISGACEILGGAGVLFSSTRRFAGIGLIALLVAVFPANLYMAQNPGLYADLGTPALFYARLPLQPLLIAWVWWVCLFRRGTI